jgi:hypothetical protein
MTGPHGIAPELVACISEARAPTLQELGRMAERIDREIYGDQPIFARGGFEANGSSRWRSYRIAHAALVGADGDVRRMSVEFEADAASGALEIAGTNP